MDDVIEELKKAAGVELRGGPMNIKIQRMVSGPVNVSWQQEMVVSSVGERTLKILIACIIGSVALLYFIPSIFTFLLFLGAMFFLWMYRREMRSYDGRENSEKPITQQVEGKAYLFTSLSPPTFTWSFVAPAEDIIDHSSMIPFDSFGKFEVVRYADWFSPRHDEKVLRWYHAIIVHTPTEGPKCVAAHAGSRAELTELVGVLTREFIENRDERLRIAGQFDEATAYSRRSVDDAEQSTDENGSDAKSNEPRTHKNDLPDKL
jgi:hypothetical protein